MPESVLIVGDNRLTLRALAENSVDAVVTDPPYGLGKEPDMSEVLEHWMRGDDFDASGGGFMGKTWDSFVPGPATWKEVYRVLKPGGHVVMFSGTRTWDLATLALRLAGFEIRDSLMWLYGSGFPKSMDVSKAIDKRQMAEVDEMRSWVKGLGTRQEVAAAAGVTPRQVDHWVGENTPCPQMISEDRFVSLCRHFDQVPTWADKMFAKLGDRLGEITHARSGGDDFAKRPGAEATSRTVDVRSTATPEAKQWEGWGTALKPAWEPIVLARKPIKGTVAANVLTYTTGALNIDVSRDALGRFPANVILSHGDCHSPLTLFSEPEMEVTECVVECPVSLLDGQTGGASRFFYTAKVSPSERNAGMPEGEINDHPTVKPIALMAYLVRLVTPSSGLVLDPFVGSGSTGIACHQEGMGFVGLDSDARSVMIAHHRIEHHGAKVSVRPSLSSTIHPNKWAEPEDED